MTQFYRHVFSWKSDILRIILKDVKVILKIGKNYYFHSIQEYSSYIDWISFSDIFQRILNISKVVWSRDKKHVSS